MPDKKYLIEIPGMPEGSGVWDSDKWERNKDAFMSDYPEANVFELGEYDAEDTNENDQIMLTFENDPDSSGVWDYAKWERNKAAFTTDHPEAKVSRVRYVDYWGNAAQENRVKREELSQPDAERDARLADLGYYDDMSGQQKDFSLENNTIGLKPVSSAIEQNSVSGETTYHDPKLAEFYANDSAHTERMAEIARLDAEYDSNPSVVAQREWEQKARAEQDKYIDDSLASIRADINTEVNALEAGKGAFYKTASSQGMGDAAMMQQAIEFMRGKDASQAYVENEKLETYTSAAKLFEKAKQANEVAGKGFWGATADVGMDKLRDLATQSDIEAYNQIGDILTRLETKLGSLNEVTDKDIESNLSKGEQALIKGFFAYNEAMSNAQQDMSQAYKGGKIFGESISFMLEFLATGGLAGGTGKAAGNAVGKGLVKWAAKAAKGTAQRAARTVATKAARSLTSAAVGTLARTVAAPGTYQRMAEDSVKIEDGHLNRAKNAFEAFTDSYIENLSEISGGVIGKSLKMAGINPSKILGSISFGKVGKMLADNSVMQAIAKGGKVLFGENGVLKKFGFNGIFEEVEEEYIGNLIRELTIQPGALEEMHKDGNFGAMLIGFAPMTIFGAGMSAASIGAKNIEAANLGKKLRENLSLHYTDQQIDHMMNLVSSAENADQVWEAIKPLTVGLSVEEAQQLLQYGAFMAQNKAMMFAKKAQEDNLAQAKRTEAEQVYGKFWQENAEGAESVQLATLNDGRSVFVLSEPTADGVVSIIDANTGEKGFTNVSNYKTQEVNGEVSPMTQKWSMDAYLEGSIAADRMTAEQARMTREYDEQVKNLQSQIQEGKQINLGTEGSPVILLATGKFVKDGVVAVDQTGNTHTVGWNQVADAMGQPIIVKTDQQIVDEEIAGIVARNAERRKKMSNATPAMTEAVNESAAQTSEAVAQETKHIPLNEDGTVNEAAFWEQDPEGYAQWNDEQNQDGGADTIQQIEAAKAELTAMLNEAQQATLTSNPANRKAAKREVSRLAERLARLEALEQSYADRALAPLRERAKMWADLTGAQVHVLETEEELAAISATAASENTKQGSRVRGFAKDGRAYIFLPGIKDIMEIDEVFFHEAVAHNGLKGLLGEEKYKELCEQIWNMMSQAARNQFIRYPGVNGDYLAAADEYIAHIAEKMGAGIAEAEEKTIWQKVVDFVRNVLRAMGIELNVTEQELSDLLHQAYADLANNMAKAEQIATGEAMSAVEEASSEARQQYDALLEDLTPEEIEAVAQNDFNAAQEAYNAHLANAPKVEPGESSKAYIERKKAYNDELKRLESELNAQQALMDEITAIKAANAPVLTDVEILEQDGFGVDTQNDDVRMSVRYTPTEEQKEAIINSIVNVTGRSREEAERWLASETSLAAMINDDLQYLDYVADPKYKAIKDNSDYPQGTVDFNNICRKRVPFTRMFTRLQRTFPNRVFTADELADIRTIMSKDGLTVACGLCYVEDRRQMVGEVAQSFIDGIQERFETYANNPTKRKNAEKFKALIGEDTYVPQVYDLTTQEGLDKLYNEHRGIWEAFQAFNNARGQQSQNLLQGYAEYKREILSWSDKKVKQVNDNGGLRIFSYSDFEAHHLIDVVQIIIDCASKGVKIQGYTKVPAFARAVANTGIKLNRSLIPLGDTGLVDGQLAFDPVEGIDINDPNFLESNDNVGNILIGINDEQIRVAMNDPRIHYIIPYHARQKENIRQKLNVGAWTNYISTQNERNISDGKRVKDNINIYTDILTEDITTDRQFVEKYLQLCAEQGRIPKFDQFLDKDAEGNYVYTPGYYKFLIDFKLFDENGNILPQRPVVAEFDDAFNMQILENYAKDERESTGEQMNETYDKIVDALGLDESAAEGEDVRFSKKTKAPETAVQPMAGHSTVVSSADGANVIKNLETLLEEYRNKPSNRQKTFIGDLARALGLRNNGNHSNYGTFEAVNGEVFTYRISDHNSSTKNMEDAGTPNGISIVITHRPNSKITKDGNAHIVEFYYNTQKLLNADGQPYADIIQSVIQSLYSGEYKDTTGLAEMDEAVSFSVITPQMDADYLAAVEAGDMETAQRMVNEAAEAAGYAKKVYRVDAFEGDKTRYKNVRGGVFYAESLDYFDHSDTGHRRSDAKPFFLNTTGFFDPMNEMRNLIVNSWGDILGRESDFEKFGIEDETFDDRGQYNDGEEILVTSTDGLAYAAQKQGYNGVILRDIPQNDGRAFTEYAAYNSNSVKSAEPVTYDDAGNVIPLSERFNPANEDIRFSIANENQAIFVSNAARAVEGIKMEKATPEQWQKMIEKNGGLKAGEDKWMGLSDWLKASDKKTLTKAEVLDFINENKIVIEEQHYSDKGVRKEADKILNENYPGWEEAFSFDWDPFMEEPHADIYDEVKAARLYNETHEDQVETDEDGDIVNDADYNKVEEFGAELSGIWHGRGRENTVREIHGTREEYTTGGLTDLHEIALTVPTIESWNESDDIHFGDAGDGRAVAWVRFGETWERRPSPQISRKVLVIDEIQSKRHQEGREKGYSSDFENSAKLQELNAELEKKTARRKELKDYFDSREENELVRLAQIDMELDEVTNVRDYDRLVAERDEINKREENALAEFDMLANQINELEYEIRREKMSNDIKKQTAIPDAPFDKNWHELAMKRMLRYAAEEGYDVIAWTKGEQQADRYNLGKIYNEIEREDNPNIKGRTFSFSGGNYDKVTVNEDGVVVDSTIEEAKGKSLSDLVGKDTAVKMMSLENYDTIDGEDLRIGGEGMKGFYDRMLPAFMNKYGKKWGVKVEDIDLSHLQSGLTMHSVPVTEEMKASVMEGQVMFSVRTVNQTAQEFHNDALTDFRRQFNLIQPTAVVDINDRAALAEALGEELSDEKYQLILDGVNNGGRSFYDDDTKRIAIFALEEQRTSAEVSENIFHENTHAIISKNPELLELGQWLWDNAKPGAREKIKSAILEADYPEWQYANEMLSRYTGAILAIGRAGEVLNMLPTEQKKHWEFILKEFGYEPEREDGERMRRYDADSRRAGFFRKMSQQKMSDNGAAARYSAEERRVINELFPGAIQEETRFSADIATELENARANVDTDPTEAQKKAGNYKMGHLRLDGYNITIENPKGSVRRGTDSKGNEWENTLNNDYGYIRGTEGVDGDHIDVYLSDNPAEGNVFVIDQVNPETREFDEHKVMYGFNSMDEAREAYLANFSEGWNGLGTITEVTKDEFRKWIDSSHRKTKPFSEYKSVKTDILDEGDIRYSLVTDPALLARLESEPSSKEITPEQSSLLKQPNSAQYPTGQELSGSKDSDNLRNSKESLSVITTPTEIEAVKGLAILDAMNISLDQEMTMVQDMIDAERALIKNLQKKNQNPLIEQQIQNAEQRLAANLRQMEILQDVKDQLFETKHVDPDYQSALSDLEPQTRFEYLSQLFTMHLTPITQAKVTAEDGTETIVRQGGKKNGIMLTPQTLTQELGWSKSDWKGISYIVSESDGTTIDAIAEMIEQDSEAGYLFAGMDTMQIKDEIIDFLWSMDTYASIRDYVKNARMRKAKEEADHTNALIDMRIEQLESEFGMSADAYNAMIVQQHREARESWLASVENPNEFTKFEEIKEEENGGASENNREGSQGVSSADEAQDVATSGEGDSSGEAIPEGIPGNMPGNERGTESGGGSRRDDTGSEGEDRGDGVVSDAVDTSRKSVDEIVETGKQKVVEANAAAADAFMLRLRNINGNLMQLRRAASAQREYDKNTVQIITSLANELLENGALSDMTRGEIKRLLSVIKDSVGKSDLAISVDRLMDIMIGNQLRYGRNRFNEYVKIRDKKVDARGIEVRGKLDVEGQMIMNALREGISLDAERLQERIGEAEDRLFDASETIRRNAENDLVGYQIALEYLDEIKASEAEEKDLRKELKTAKEEYEADRMTKEAYKEFVKATHDAIRENRMQRVMAYEGLLEKMANMIQKSIRNAGQLREAEKVRIEQIQHYANSDLQGKQATAHKQQEGGFWNWGLVKLFTAPLATFEQWMRVFGQKSAEGKGYLYNHFVGGWNKANNDEYLGIKAAHEILDAKVREMFGGAARRWSDLFAIDKKLPKATVTMWDDGEMRDFEVTQGNLLYIYMVNKMTDGKMKLRKMGITEEDVAAMVRAMDPRFIELADWIQEDFLPGLRDKYNAVHEKLFGAPMSAIENYFPIKVLANARTREVSLGEDTEGSKPSTITGSIIKRTKNSLALDVLGSNAFDVVLEHIEQMEHWAAFAGFNRDLNTLLSYNKFRNRVQNMNTALGSGKEAWNSFKETAEIVAGVYQPKASKADKTLTNVVRGLTAGKINFRLWTALKQILSMPAFLPYTNAKSFARNLATPWKAWNWAIENLPAFQKRWLSREAGNVRLQKTEADWKLWQNDIMEAASRWGMTPNAFVDAITCSIGAKSVYDTMYARYTKDGYAPEEAAKKAKLDATVAFNATQQSNEAAFVSAVQKDRSFIAYAMTVFRNNSFGMGRELADALRNMRDRMKSGYKEESIEFMTKQMVRDGLTEEQAARAAERIYRNSGFKDAARIATFGFVMQFLWNLGNSALYLLFGDDDEEKEKMIKDAAIRGAFGSAEGLGFGNIIAEASAALVSGDIKNYRPSFSPAGSDIKGLMNELKSDPVSAASEIINILAQAIIGVNPQTLVDAALAIYDACDGDMKTSKEVAIALLRILNAPQSNIDKLIMDEIDFTDEQELDMTIAEFARNYAKYKKIRNAPYTFIAYSDEKDKKVEDKYIKRFMKDAEAAKRTRGTEEAKEFYGYYDAGYEEMAESIRDIKKQAKEAYQRGEEAEAESLLKQLENLTKTEEFKLYEDAAVPIKAYEGYKNLLKDINDPKARKAYTDSMLVERDRAVKALRKHKAESR